MLHFTDPIGKLMEQMGIIFVDLSMFKLGSQTASVNALLK